MSLSVVKSISAVLVMWVLVLHYLLFVIDMIGHTRLAAFALTAIGLYVIIDYVDTGL